MINEQEENRKGLNNVLKFILKELDGRVTNIRISPTADNKKYFELDYETYRAMRKMAKEFGVDTRIYDSQLEVIIEPIRGVIKI